MSEWLINLYQGPGWLAGTLLELGIITFIVYSMFSFMRGTRGAGVLRGLILVYLTVFLVLLFVARVLDLANLSAILEQLVSVSLIGLMVIFQPEIRRGLVRLGEHAWRVFTGREGALETELCEAAFAISRHGEVGALFVLERDTKVGGSIESGITVDATVSSQLLRTIFTKNTPLHDGAVIIRGGRIAAASCLLPLSENVEVCRGMGTRHRAAIGLTEETDALVIVVSEETGAVSLAFEGRMEQDLDFEQLSRFLKEHSYQMEDGAIETTGGTPNA